MHSSIDPCPPTPSRRTWLRKFAEAGRGLLQAMHGQSSFAVHLVAMALVIVGGVALGVQAVEWGILILCMALVITAETLNSAMEQLVRTLHPAHHADIGTALHMASGAVLASSIGAAATGAVIFLNRLL